MVDWIEVRITVPPGTEEVAAEAFLSPPFTGMTVENGRVVTYFSSAHDGPGERAQLRARLLDAGALDVAFTSIADQDFANSWRETWRAFRVGRIAIVPGAASPSLRATDIALRLDPGGAFGTGRHGSTRGALRLLQDYVQPGHRILDAGAGSGILGVAAALLGAGSVLGFDIDPNAKPHCDELAAANGIANRCEFFAGGFDEVTPDPRGYDGVLANIYLDVLLGYGRWLRDRVAPGGFFVMSGVRFTERERLFAHLAAIGLNVESETRRGRWLSVAGRRPA
jgi:ribosomal protein L11 methyltransferase